MKNLSWKLGVALLTFFIGTVLALSWFTSQPKPEELLDVSTPLALGTETVSVTPKPMNISSNQKNRKSKLPSFVKGTWEVVRFVEIGGHAYEKPDLAQAEVGKKITFDKFAVKYDKNFLFFEDTCENTRYKIVKRPFEAGDKGSLWFYDLPEAQDKRVENFVVGCIGEDRYYFDVTKDKQLSIYFDGWFFFLKKIID